MNKAFTQRYKTHRTANGFGFTFYCDLCEKPFSTDIIVTYSYTEAFQQAQVMAKLHFNKCHKCGKWVCDEHYNKNVMMCIECQPKGEAVEIARKIKAISPLICRRCGYEIEEENCFCTKCGNKTQSFILKVGCNKTK